MILTTLIVSASLCGQAPAPKPSALATKPAPAPSAETPSARKLIAKRKNKKAAAYVNRLNQDEADAQIARAQAAEARRQYERMLPYMLEDRRQQLDRMSAAERNAALGRMAGAMERQAGYVYPGQSPSAGPYAPAPNFIPPNPLYGPLLNPPQ